MEINPVVAVALDYLCDFLTVHINKLVKVLNEQVPAHSISAGDGHFCLEFVDSRKVSKFIKNIIHAVREPVSAFLGVGHKQFVLL